MLRHYLLLPRAKAANLTTPGDSLVSDGMTSKYSDGRPLWTTNKHRRHICSGLQSAFVPRPRYGGGSPDILACESTDSSYHSPFPEVGPIAGRIADPNDRNNADQPGPGGGICATLGIRLRQKNGAIKGGMGGGRGRKVITINVPPSFLSRLTAPSDLFLLGGLAFNRKK